MKKALNSFAMMFLVALTFMSGSSKNLLGKAAQTTMPNHRDGAGGASGASCG